MTTVIAVISKMYHCGDVLHICIYVSNTSARQDPSEELGLCVSNKPGLLRVVALAIPLMPALLAFSPR